MTTPNFKNSQLGISISTDHPNVGIGTDSPAHKLDVAGETRIMPRSSPSGHTLYLGRHAYQASIKAEGSTRPNQWMIIDSAGSGMRTALNYFTDDDVLLAYGGGNVGIGNSSPSHKLDVVYPDSGCVRFADPAGSGIMIGDCALSSNATYAGMQHTKMVGTYMMVSDGDDTYISARDTHSVFIRGGGNAAEAEIGIHDVGAGGVGIVFNEQGSDRDIRMEGAGDANLFRLDAGEDRIGIGIATPSTKLHVSGIITANGGNSNTWNSAYALAFSAYTWGNHSSAGYATTGVLSSVSGHLQTQIDATPTGHINVSGATDNYFYQDAANNFFVHDLMFDQYGHTTGVILAQASGFVTSAGIDGDGVSNYIAIWNDADTLTSGVIYQSGDNIGVGILAPQARFHLINNDSNIADFQIGDTETSEPWFSTRLGSAFISAAFGPSTSTKLGGFGGDPDTCRMRYYGSKLSSGNYWLQESNYQDYDIRAYIAGSDQGSKIKVTTSGVVTFNNAYSFPDGDGTAGHSLVTDGAGNLSFSNVTIAGSGVDAAMTQGRLTVESGVAVSYNDTTSSTIYFTPFRGNKVALYNGSTWGLHTLEEISLDISALSTDSNYDMFIYNNAGTLTLESLIWSSHSAGTSTRATDLVLQDGVYVKSGDATRKYIGSFRTLSSAETRDADDSRLLWNYYNRIRKRVRAQLSTDSSNVSWTYNSATVRAIANNTTVGNGRFIIMNGLIEDALQMTAVSLTNGGSNSMTTTIGYNSTTSRTSSIAAGPYAVAGSASPAAIAILVHTPGIGYHFYQQQEHRNYGSSTYTGYARNTVGHSHTGIEGEFLC